MTLNPTPSHPEILYWITLVAVIVSSASTVLIAGFKKFNLFGVVIIAIATGPGGGSLLFSGLLHYDIEITVSAIVASMSIFIARLVALYFNISLPRLRFKGEK